MHVRFYIDPGTARPHIHRHGITEAEVEDVSRVAVGQTRGGRYLRVIYVPDPLPESVFVVTAYDLQPKALRALRRRRKRKA